MALKDIGPEERVRRLERLELKPAKLPPPPVWRPGKSPYT